MNRHFKYRVTADDLLNASKSYPIMGKGRDASIWRVLMLIGAFLACVPIWNHSFIAIFPLGLGCLMISIGLFIPLNKRRQIVRSLMPNEEISIFIESNKICVQKTASEKKHPISEIDFLFWTPSGFLLGFYDDSTAWLPIRAFASQEEINSCKEYLTGKIEDSED